MIKQLLCFIFCYSFLNGAAQKNIQLEGYLPFSEKINDIWGYEDLAGNSYALIGSEGGFNIVDVTTPSIPELLFTITGDTSPWRVFKQRITFS